MTSINRQKNKSTYMINNFAFTSSLPESKIEVLEAIPDALIYKADCLDFLSRIPEQSVDLIVTDPAYSGMNNKMQFGNGRIVGKYQDKTNTKWFPEFKDDPETFLFFLKECFRIMKNDSHIYIMIDSFSLLTLGHLVREVFNMKNILVWDKVNMGMGHHFRRRHEFILFASKGNRKLKSRSIPDVWRIKRITKASYPTQKPVEVFDCMLAGSTNQGDIVCDPFIGSGSSAIAALKASCKFIGADVSNRAVNICVDRLKEFSKTGVDPLQKEPIEIGLNGGV